MARSKLDITRRENGRDVLDAKRLSRIVIDNTISKLSCDTTEGVLLVIAGLTALIAMPSLMFGLLGFDSLIATTSDSIKATCMQLSNSSNCKLYAEALGLLKTIALVAAVTLGLIALAALLSLGHRKLVKDNVQDQSGYRRTRKFMEGCATNLVFCLLAFAALSIETDATQWLMPVDKQPPAISASYDRFNPGLSTARGAMSENDQDVETGLKPAPRAGFSGQSSAKLVFPGQPGYKPALIANHEDHPTDDGWYVNSKTGTAKACVGYRMRTNLYSTGQVVCTMK